MAIKTFVEKVKSWRQGESGFYQWVDDIKPKVLTQSNQYEIFQPTAKQKKNIKEILKTDKAGNFIHTISLNIEPRRHGKSTVFALIILWLFTSQNNWTCQLLGSTEDHCRRTQFNTLKKIINNTPKLSNLIPESNQLSYVIIFPELSNQIQYSASNTASAFGDKINLFWVSDFHSFLDLGPFNAYQAALLDSKDSLNFIDSNVDNTDGHVHVLQREAATDLSIFCNYTYYKNFEHYAKAAPAWIDRAKAKRLEKTSLPADYNRDILGQRSDAKNALFSSDIIELCKSKYHAPVESIEAITKGRAYKVGGGLDRAKSLIAGPRGDYTVWTVILKVATEGGEPEFYILNQKKFLINSSKNIKSVILADHKKYNLNNVILENYEVSEIYSWMIEQQIPCELISAHDTNQMASFPEMYRIFKEGRFHFPENNTEFESELSTFTYTKRNNNTYSFGHSSAKFHDDTVYSTNWAIFSLRREILNLFELDLIQCHSHTNNRYVCVLMGGNLTLHCGQQCSAFQEVTEMFKRFKQFQMDSELSLPEFFQAYVRVTGPVIYQAV